MWGVWEASFLHCLTSKVTALLRALQARREFTPVLLFGVECFVSGALHACVCPDRVACPIVACRRIPVTREPAPPQLLSASCPSNSLLQYPCHAHPLRTYRTHNTQETLQNILEGRKELMEQLWTMHSLSDQIYVLSMSTFHEGCNLHAVSTGNHALNQAAGVTLAAYPNPNDI